MYSLQKGLESSKSNSRNFCSYEMKKTFQNFWRLLKMSVLCAIDEFLRIYRLSMKFYLIKLNLTSSLGNHNKVLQRQINFLVILININF